MNSPFNILTVDDNEIVSIVLSNVLKGAGFTVSCAASAREALEALEAEGFDLLLIDIQMPQTDGFELLEDLRSDERFAHVPALMLTVSDDIAEVKRARSLGARGFLTKPFDDRQLAAKAMRVMVSPEVAWIDDHHCLLQPASSEALSSPRRTMVSAL